MVTSEWFRGELLFMKQEVELLIILEAEAGYCVADQHHLPLGNGACTYIRRLTQQFLQERRNKEGRKGRETQLREERLGLAGPCRRVLNQVCSGPKQWHSKKKGKTFAHLFAKLCLESLQSTYTKQDQRDLWRSSLSSSHSLLPVLGYCL